MIVTLRFGRLAACAAALALTSTTWAFEVQQNVAFTTKGQSPYGPGNAFEILEPGLNILKQPLLLNAGPAININAWDAFLGGLLPSDLLPNIFSLEAGFGAHGTNNLDLGYYVTGGRLDVTYPASSKLTFGAEQAEKRVVANESYSIGAQFLPGVDQRTIPSQFWTTLGPGGPELWLSKKVTGEGGFTFQTGQPPPSISNPSFVVHSPYASAWLDSRIDLRVGAYAKITALGGLIDEGVDFTFGASVGDRIAEIDPSGLYVAGAKVSDVSLTDPIPISVPIQGGSAKLQLPRLGLASDSQQGAVIRGFDKQPILSVQGNLEKLIPGVGQFLEGSIGPFGYKLVTVSGGPVVSLYQDMKFDAKPQVRLRFSEPVLVQGTQMGDVVIPGPGQLIPTTIAQMPVQGGTLTWQPMISFADEVVISPTYILNNDFTTKVGVDLSVEGRVEALEVTHPFGSTGPLIEAEFSESLANHDLFNKTFTVPINDVIASRVTISKTNINILTGEDLKFSQFFFTPDQPPGAVKYDIEFTRRLADGSTRTYLAPGVVGQQDFYSNGLPDPPEGEGSYGLFAANGPIVVVDPVTGEQFDLGRHILTGNYEVSSLLPADSPNYSPQPDPLLPDFVPPLFANVVSASPEIPINTSVDPYLKAYNELAFDPTEFGDIGAPSVADRRNGARTDVIVKTGDPLPDAAGEFGASGFGRASMNNAGRVVFQNGPGSAAYMANGPLKTNVVKNLDAAPGGLVRLPTQLLSKPMFNDADAMLVDAFVDLTGGGSARALLTVDPLGINVIAREGVPAPDGNGELVQIFGANGLNDAGQVVFTAAVRNGAGQFENAIYRGDVDGLSKIARVGDPAPGIGGTFSGVSSAAINNAGQVAFVGVAGAAFDKRGVFITNGSDLIPISTDVAPLPDGSRIIGYSPPVINARGEVAFTTIVDLPEPVFRNDFAAFKWNGDELVQLARPDQLDRAEIEFIRLNDAGDVAFQTNGGVYRYTSGTLTPIAQRQGPAPLGREFGSMTSGEEQGGTFLNNGGQIAFSANTTAAGSDGRREILIHDGTQLVSVAQVGQELAGSTILSLALDDFNDRMQVVYQAKLVDGRDVIARFDPSLYWKTPGGGQWETDANWSLGVDPGAPYDAFIIAPQPLTVMGPAADSAVRSLVLGGDHTAAAMLDLVNGATLSIGEGARIRANGVLLGQGTIDGDVLNEGGTVSPGNSPGMLHIEGGYLQGPLGKLALEIAGPNAGSQYDVLDVTGDVVLAGEVEISFLDGYAPAPGTRFDLIAYDGAFDASQAEFVVTGAPPGSQFQAFAANGVFGIAAVPEPGAAALALIAMAVGPKRRRR